MGEIQRYELGPVDCMPHCYGGVSKMELVEGDYHWPEFEWVKFTDHERVVAEAFAAGREAGLEEAKEKAERVLVEHLGKRKLTRPKLMIDLLAALSGETD